MKNGIPMLIIIMAILLIKSVWSWADYCSETCTYWDNGRCARTERKCYTSDSDSSSAPVIHYGAIAYGRTKKSYGTSYKWPSRAKAENMALQSCSKYENDCEIAVWFKNKCGAVATRSDNQLYYWGLGNTEKEANSVAMNECAKNNGQKCTVLISQCASNK